MYDSPAECISLCFPGCGKAALLYNPLWPYTGRKCSVPLVLTNYCLPYWSLAEHLLLLFTFPRWSREISIMWEGWPPILHCLTVSRTLSVCLGAISFFSFFSFQMCYSDITFDFFLLINYSASSSEFVFSPDDGSEKVESAEQSAAAAECVFVSVCTER